MSALALRGHHPRPHVTRRGVLVLAVVALAAIGVVAIGERWTADDGASVTAIATVSPATAIDRWLVEAREDVFPGAPGAYLGACPADTPGFTVGLCSRLSEDLGTLQIHAVGVYATDWGADVLLERGANGWAVIDVSPWPQLGSLYFGPPWSPMTAIGAWWSDGAVPSATERFGAGAVHLRSCTEATEVADVGTGQPLLCSALVEERNGARVYESGLADRPFTVRLVVTEQPRHAWRVTDVEEI